MCGRYTLIKLSDFTDMFPWIRSPDELPPPRYNVAPTQPVAVVTNEVLDKDEVKKRVARLLELEDSGHMYPTELQHVDEEIAAFMLSN